MKNKRTAERQIRIMEERVRRLKRELTIRESLLEIDLIDYKIRKLMQNHNKFICQKKNCLKCHEMLVLDNTAAHLEQEQFGMARNDLLTLTKLVKLILFVNEKTFKEARR